MILLTALAFIPRIALSCETPAFASITPDGDFDDWGAVFANQANTVFDGGGKIECSESIDRDCPVDHEEDDIRLFAWTMDETTLSFFFERFKAEGPDRYFYVFIDSEMNGTLDLGEKLVQLKYSGDKRTVDPLVFELTSWGGIALADPEGFADGFSPSTGSSTFAVFSDPPKSDAGGGASKRNVEAVLDLSAVGLLPYQPFDFHVCSGRDNDPKKSFEDNLGAPEGGIGTVRFTDFDVAGNALYAVSPGSVDDLHFLMVNTGNIASVLNMRVFSELGLRCVLYEDGDGDGTPDDLMAVDGNGDGDFDDTAGGMDFVQEDFDSDGDGHPDTGELAPEEEFHLIVRILIPEGTEGLQFHTRLDVFANGCVEEKSSLIRVNVVDIGPNGWFGVTPDATLRISHYIKNLTAERDTMTIGVLSSVLGYPIVVYTDTDGNGVPDEAMAADTEGDGFWDFLDPAADSNGDSLPDTGQQVLRQRGDQIGR